MKFLHKSWVTRSRGVGILAAAYLYFLLFAEFAFLEVANISSLPATQRQAIMILLGVGGIAGSSSAAWILRKAARSSLPLGFISCAAACACALRQTTPNALALTAGWIGVSVGWITVVIATRFEVLMGKRHLGLWCGLGTGLAYFLCNLPIVFNASPQTQTEIALVAGAVGAVLAFNFEGHFSPMPVLVTAPQAIKILILFTGLVWLDSSAFYIIQHTEAIKALTWHSRGSLLSNAFIHLTSAVLAGCLLDRGQSKFVLGAAACLLFGACECIHNKVGVGGWIAFLYTGGVSFYSTALVWFPARFQTPLYTACLYSISGWIGSALGIGMAQDIHDIPLLMPLVIGIILGAVLLVKRRAADFIPIVIAGAILTPQVSRASTASEATIKAGREVYISEGCIYCHSQFLRPRVVPDVEQWGPIRASPSQLNEVPPLFGNRRQGPDLSTVGDRRSPEWEKWHLRGPELFTPHSRMPSYAHLFNTDNSRGDDLIAYLLSLHSGDSAQRQEEIGRWTPHESDAIAQINSAKLFSQLCSVCHGAEGRGDGFVGTRLEDRPPNFKTDSWRHLSPSKETSDLALARIVKFGIPGTSMPGHEYLDDNQVVALASYVKTLHRTEYH